MHRVFKRGVLYFIRSGGTKNWILFGGSRQEFIEFFVMHKTGMSLAKVVKNVRREGIRLRTHFLRMGIFSRAGGIFK